MLSTIASLFAVVGLVLLVIGGLAFLIAAFQESLLWGLAVLFLPLASLVFLVTNWGRAKGAFVLQLYGVGCFVVAVLLAKNHLPWPLH